MSIEQKHQRSKNTFLILIVSASGKVIARLVDKAENALYSSHGPFFGALFGTLISMIAIGATFATLGAVPLTLDMLAMLSLSVIAFSSTGGALLGILTKNEFNRSKYFTYLDYEGLAFTKSETSKSLETKKVRAELSQQISTISKTEADKIIARVNQTNSGSSNTEPKKKTDKTLETSA